MNLNQAVAMYCAHNLYKPRVQFPHKIAEGGRWAVADPEGLIMSTHQHFEDAQRAASAKRYAKVIDLGATEEYRKRFLGKKSKALQEADYQRSGMLAPKGEQMRRTTGGSGGVAGPGGEGG